MRRSGSKKEKVRLIIRHWNSLDGNEVDRDREKESNDENENVDEETGSDDSGDEDKDEEDDEDDEDENAEEDEANDVVLAVLSDNLQKESGNPAKTRSGRNITRRSEIDFSFF